MTHRLDARLSCAPGWASTGPMSADAPRLLACLITTGLSAFGIYVLAAYNVQRRAREIVLRRLFGARSYQIVMTLSVEFAVAWKTPEVRT